MNHLCVIFYFINIFAVYVNSASLGSAMDIFDVASKNFSKSCPALSSNILVNSTSKYLSNCKELSFTNPPTKIDLININKFYCIGILVADMQLCNSLTTYEYKKLPQTLQELETEIEKIQKVNPLALCTELKRLNVLNNENIIPGFVNTVKVLKKELNGDFCAKFCSEYLNENATTNELCSMMYYIHDHIKNVSQITAQEKVILSTPRDSQVAEVKNEITSEKLPIAEIDKKRVQIQSVSKTNNDENKGHMKSIADPQLQQNVEPKEHDVTTISIKNPKTTIYPESNIDKGSIAVLPNAPGDHQPVAKEPAIKEASPTVKGENQSKQTKHNGDDTNKAQKEIKPLVEKTTESALVDDKVEITTTISTELNFFKQHSDTIEYDDDGDIDDTGKLNDDTNPMPDNIQNGFSNGRTEFSPNKQTVDVEEESNFFSYFMFFSVMFIAGYVIYHNKQKIMALILEGRRDRNSRRRPSTSSYRKLNSNLEEAVTSKCSGSASHVIY